MTIRISRRKLRTWLRLPVGLLAAVALLIIPYWVGKKISPAPLADGRVPIYSPSVRRTETYRRTASRWLTDLQTLDTALVTALRADSGNVYDLSQQGQTALDQAVRTAQAVALAYPPASLVALRDALQEAADAYLQAAVALNRWVGEPTPETHAGVLETLRQARAALARAEENPRLQNPILPDEGPLPTLEPVAPGVHVPDPQGGWGDEP